MAGAALLSGCEAPADTGLAACTKTWVGVSLGSWTRADNWSPPGVPSPDDVACSERLDNLLVDGPVQVRSVRLQGMLTIAATGTLDVSGDPGIALIGGLQLDGRLTGSTTKVLTGGSVVLNGDIDGSGVVDVSEGTPLTLTSLRLGALTGTAAFQTDAPFTWTGTIRMCGTSVWRNTAAVDVTWNAATARCAPGDSPSFDNDGAVTMRPPAGQSPTLTLVGHVVNHGTLATTGMGTVQVHAEQSTDTFDNHGLVEARDTGVITVDSPSSAADADDGTYRAAQTPITSAFTVGIRFFSSPVAGGPNVRRFDGGVVASSSDKSAVYFAGPDVAGPMSVSGRLQWAGGSLGSAGATISVLPGATFGIGVLSGSPAMSARVVAGGTIIDNAGTVSLGGGTSSLCGAATVVNSGTVSGGGTLERCSPADVPVLVNHGLVEGTAALSLAVPVTSDGTLRATAGVLSVGVAGSTFDNAGIVDAAGGTVSIDVPNSGGTTDAGAYSASGSSSSVRFTGTGTRRFGPSTSVTTSGGGALELAGQDLDGVTSLPWRLRWRSGHAVAPGGSLQITASGELDIDPATDANADAADTRTVPAGAQVDNSGIIRIRARHLALCDGARLANGGQLYFETLTSTTASVERCAPGDAAVMTNSGSLTASTPSSGVHSINVPFDNSGAVSSTTAKLLVNGPNSPGAQDSGTYSANTASSWSQITFSGGGTRTFGPAASVQGVVLDGQDFSGLQNVAGTVEWRSGRLLDADDALTIPATTTLSVTGSVTMCGASSLTNNGTLKVQGDITRCNVGDAPAIVNNGTATYQNGGARTIGVPFDNAGTVDSLTIADGNSPGASDTGTYGYATFTGGTRRGVKVVNGGTWSGGTWAGTNVVSTGATLTLGSGTRRLDGSLTNSGTINWNAGVLDTGPTASLTNNGTLNITSTTTGANPSPVAGTGSATFTNNSSGIVYANSTGSTTLPFAVSNLGSFRVITGTFTVGGYVQTAGDTRLTGSFAPYSKLVVSSGVATISGGRLQGLGTFASALTLGGDLRPGSPGSPTGSIGTLTIEGNLSVSSTATFNFEVATASSYDRLVVTGTTTLAGSFSAAFGPTPGTPPIAYASLISSAGGLSGTFSTVTTTGLASGTFGVAYTGSAMNGSLS